MQIITSGPGFNLRVFLKEYGSILALTLIVCILFLLAYEPVHGISNSVAF